MAQKLNLVLALHNHQPVGNFDWVFEEAYQKAYLPMLEALERHPKIQMAIHNSGCLIDWLLVNQPDYLVRLRKLVERGQVEILTGGYYEPILVALPDVDKVGQIQKLSQTIEEHFGVKPKGMWLTERVWDAHLPVPLAEAGVNYTIVDDTHFRFAGVPDEEMFGYYITEEQGRPLNVFASTKHLRYSLPWDSVALVMSWLWEMAKRPLVPKLYEDRIKVAVMGDDGEKFGLWPNTYKHCWEDGWVEQFFVALENNHEWLQTVLPSQVIEDEIPLGRIYLPDSSYDEMTEWALPANVSREMILLKKKLEYEEEKGVLRFFKGGPWRTFLRKYPEANLMHKKSLWVSEKIRKLDPSAEKERALDHLWAAQCNCGYWHGLFGGLYLFHIRSANYKNLLAAENIVDQLSGEESEYYVRKDFDLDGHPELVLSNEDHWMLFDLTLGGALRSWDYRPTTYQLLNTVSRRPEWYHQDLIDAAIEGKSYLAEKEKELPIESDWVRVKECGLENRLFYDWYWRAGLQDHFLRPNTRLASYEQAKYGELGDFITGEYQVVCYQTAYGIDAELTRKGNVWQGVEGVPVTVSKRICLLKNGMVSIDYQLKNHAERPLQALFGVENNWGLEGGQDSLAYILGLGKEAIPLNGRGQATNIREISLVNEVSTVQLKIDISFDQPTRIWYFPLETVTNSEGGFERNYQGTSVTSLWLLQLEPEEMWTVGMKVKISSLSG